MEKFKHILIQTSIYGGILLGIFALGYGGFQYAHAIHLFGLEKVVVDGTTLISNEEVLQLADLKFGTSLFDLPLDSIQTRISENPFVLATQVSRQFPRTLFIQVHERKPIAYVNHGVFSCIDKHDYLMPLPRMGMNLPIPIVSGFNRTDTLQENGACSNVKLNQMVEVLNVIQQDYSAFYPQISELVFTGENDYIIYTADSATRIYLGQSDLTDKVELLHAFWSTIGDRKQWSNYEYIDLRYKKQVIVRERT